MEIININDFFDFDNHSPINRIAYTEEDAKYKLTCIKAMQDLGMKISIDKVGNICGTFSGNHVKNKSLVIGSHTVSVLDGGQFDGPVGVYMALKAAENFKENNIKQYGNLKVIIYACEESTRFSKACLGSYYLSDTLTYDELINLKDKKGISFENAVFSYKQYISSHLKDYGINPENLQYVDKILEAKEISEAIESHIEQAQVLTDSNNSIGIVDSISKPLRGTITINGKNSIVSASKIIKDLNTLAKHSNFNSSEETLRITIPQFDSNIINSTEENSKAKKYTTPLDGGILLNIDVIGQNDHSGAAPMDKRQDAVLGLANLILKLENLQNQNPNMHFDFLGSSTKKWGANQIQNHANLVLKINSPEFLEIIKSLAKDVQNEDNVSFEINPTNEVTVTETPFSKLFVDVRQQYPICKEETREQLYSVFKTIQHNNNFKSDSISFKISSTGNPIQTTPELLENIKQICDKKNYPCMVLHSWPGHDLACVLDPNHTIGKKILFFIPSTGGSHNPNESTTKKDIEIGTDVYSTLVSQRMNKFRDDYERNIR